MTADDLNALKAEKIRWDYDIHRDEFIVRMSAAQFDGFAKMLALHWCTWPEAPCDHPSHATEGEIGQ